MVTSKREVYVNKLLVSDIVESRLNLAGLCFSVQKYDQIAEQMESARSSLVDAYDHFANITDHKALKYRNEFIRTIEKYNAAAERYRAQGIHVEPLKQLERVSEYSTLSLEDIISYFRIKPEIITPDEIPLIKDDSDASEE